MNYVIAIVISVLINTYLTGKFVMSFYEETMDRLQNERKKNALIETMLQGLLENRDKETLLKFYKDKLSSLEEGE